MLVLCTLIPTVILTHLPTVSAIPTLIFAVIPTLIFTAPEMSGDLSSHIVDDDPSSGLLSDLAYQVLAGLVTHH